MNKDKQWYCNEADCWSDELTKEDKSYCALGGDCAGCEVSTGYETKEEKAGE